MDFPSNHTGSTPKITIKKKLKKQPYKNLLCVFLVADLLGLPYQDLWLFLYFLYFF
jgi:hypothetical protein